VRITHSLAARQGRADEDWTVVVTKIFRLVGPLRDERAQVETRRDPVLVEIGDVTDSGAPLGPGESVTISVETSGKFKYVSVAAMLVPTNDAFVAVNGVRGPKGKDALVIDALAYDAGTELNDESCASIPAGGGCAGEGVSLADGEGFVHVHPGIHGVGGLSEATYDWRNPVARVRIVKNK
jgi:hypothetical protein